MTQLLAIKFNHAVVTLPFALCPMLHSAAHLIPLSRRMPEDINPPLSDSMTQLLAIKFNHAVVTLCPLLCALCYTHRLISYPLVVV